MSYFLPEGYKERLGAPQSYDVGGTDEWQDEVYRTARDLAIVMGLRSVVDFGCGAGFKLMKYFGEFDTVGVDLEAGVKNLSAAYPGRRWLTADQLSLDGCDLIICSDVIEHVDYPDDLLSLLKSAKPRWLVLSTPDRQLMAKFPKWTTNEGPPGNGCHVREWNFEEFGKYMDHHFRVERHFHSNRKQCTQCVIARLKH